MNIHVLQHVSFEGPGHIADWAKLEGHSLSYSHLYKKTDFPGLDSFGMLVVMGGPMNIYEEDRFPWLVSEKNFIRKAIDCGKLVLGICLGSQLIADVLGAKVSKNAEVEIGWFPVTKSPAARLHPLLQGIDFGSPVFHWHGDTFDLPRNAVNLLESEGCKNQMFAFADNVLAIQFHPEATPEAVGQMILHGRGQLQSSRFIQTEAEISRQFFSKPNALLSRILDRFTSGS